jgi:lambda repressor-like predicted transcriptional regulator
MLKVRSGTFRPVVSNRRCTEQEGMNMRMSAADGPVPDWVPDAARHYLEHIGQGTSLRALARRAGCHPSTVMRQVRRFENRRDDPLIDEVLATLAPRMHPHGPPQPEEPPMTAMTVRKHPLFDEATIAREARRVLRRLAEPGAVLAVAPEMEKAAVLREGPGGISLRTAVLDRQVAQAFALKDWIVCRKPGRVTSYEITTAGRAALRRMLELDAAGQPEAAALRAGHQGNGLAEAPQPYAAQHRIWGERSVIEPDAAEPRKLRVNLAENPVSVLGRRRDKDGKPFLEPELVAAAERLRQDFEIAQMGPRIAQNWERFLTAGADRGGFVPGSGAPGDGPRAARDRVAAALRDLGPGLSDMVLRCCCFLEGLETAERRMGWSARSGKIVLRIALMRLRRHYDDSYGGTEPLIG